MPPGVEKKIYPAVVAIVLEWVWGGVESDGPGKGVA